MPKFVLIPLLSLSGALCIHADTVQQPVLQWVQAFGGSGVSQVTGAATDGHGNLYITGSTTSIDFPANSAVQPGAGASTLYRIDSSGTGSQKLYPPGLSAVSSIAADPENPQIIYATQTNTIWQSVDGGQTFSLLATLPTTTVRSVAVDRSDSNTIYAATVPKGVFKSTDGGLTWTASNNGIRPESNGNIAVTRIVADPVTPHVLFAAAITGLMRSTDGGASWAVSVSGSYVDSSLAFDPFNPGTLYLILSNGSGLGIGKSIDGGVSFGTPVMLPGKDVFPNSLLVDPHQPGVLYTGAFGELFQSSDGGATWTKKADGTYGALTADPNSSALYAIVTHYGIVRSTDGFTTVTPVGPAETGIFQIVVAGPSVFVATQPSADAFVVKLDSTGAVVYSTYFGGSAEDHPTAIAVDSAGSVYVGGTTASIDFPTTAEAYTTKPPPSSVSNFVFKLNPDGSLGWSTYFSDAGSIIRSIAVDDDHNVYIGGSTAGGLPTTPGAYQTQFSRITACFPGSIVPCFPGPTAAFVTKIKADGTGLIFSTYVSTDTIKQVVQQASALTLDHAGNAYFAGANVVELNADGSALLASTIQAGISIAALARDPSGNVYITGTVLRNTGPIGAGGFTATPGAFQRGPQPAIQALPGQLGAGGISDAFVMKFDPGLSQILAATLLGGELADDGESIAVDSSGTVIVSGATDSKAFPTRAPFQASFSSRSGFVAGLSSDLTQLLFSTYLGDGRQFEASAVVPDGQGNILLAGSTLGASSLFIGGDPGLTFSVGNLVVANKIMLPPAPALRIDSVVNFASRIAAPIAPDEAIAVVGSGFGPDAKLLVDGAVVPLVSQSSTNLSAVMPDNAKTSGGYRIEVSTGGALSNPVFVPAAPASPGILSVDGSGYGQGYILNSDGTLNSPANPTTAGSPITIFATGTGQLTFAGQFAVTALAPSVFIDGFYANGIAATVGPVPGFPGNLYQLSVFVPDPAKFANLNPNLLDFKMPPQVAVKLIFGPVNPSNPDNSVLISQNGLVLSVKQP